MAFLSCTSIIMFLIFNFYQFYYLREVQKILCRLYIFQMLAVAIILPSIMEGSTNKVWEENMVFNYVSNFKMRLLFKYVENKSDQLFY